MTEADGPRELTARLEVPPGRVTAAAAARDVELLGEPGGEFTARGRAADLVAFWEDAGGDGLPELRRVGIPALPGAPEELRHLRDRLCAGDFTFGEEEVEEDGDRSVTLESDAVEVLFARTRGTWAVELTLPDWDAWHDADLVLEALGTGAGLAESLDALVAADPIALQDEVERRRAA